MSNKAAPWSPWVPPKYEIADAAAVQALVRGDATADQQQRAMSYIINVLSGTYDLSFRPGVTGDRETTFAEGKRFVGLELVKLTKIDISVLKRKE